MWMITILHSKWLDIMLKWYKSRILAFNILSKFCRYLFFVCVCFIQEWISKIFLIQNFILWGLNKNLVHKIILIDAPPPSPTLGDCNLGQKNFHLSLWNFTIGRMCLGVILKENATDYIFMNYSIYKIVQ